MRKVKEDTVIVKHSHMILRYMVSSCHDFLKKLAQFRVVLEKIWSIGSSRNASTKLTEFPKQILLSFVRFENKELQACFHCVYFHCSWNVFWTCYLKQHSTHSTYFYINERKNILKFSLLALKEICINISYFIVKQKS